MEISVRFRRGEVALFLARRVVANALAESGCLVDPDVAVLLMDELTANAERHAGGALEVSVQVGGTRVWVEVQDADPRAPVLREPGALDEGGRGLWLVDHLATAWGVRPLAGDRKAVWFEVRAD
ncbi:MAG: ATP-binding protein [Actinomycetota bacterium]|nr:ATP-binding protein [Actinomycetota bacterium]